MLSLNPLDLDTMQQMISSFTQVSPRQRLPRWNSMLEEIVSPELWASYTLRLEDFASTSRRAWFDIFALASVATPQFFEVYIFLRSKNRRVSGLTQGSPKVRINLRCTSDIFRYCTPRLPYCTCVPPECHTYPYVKTTG